MNVHKIADRCVAGFEIFAAAWTIVLFLVLLYVAVPTIYHSLTSPHSAGNARSCK